MPHPCRITRHFGIAMKIFLTIIQLNSLLNVKAAMGRK